MANQILDATIPRWLRGLLKDLRRSLRNYGRNMSVSLIR